MRKHLLLISLPLLAALQGAASDFEVVNENGVTLYYDYNIDGTSVSVTYKAPDTPSYSGIVAIPETASDGSHTYSVSGIGERAFADCDNLAWVGIPTSVTTIGAEAFQYCSMLKEVTIPASVSSLGHRAFQKCIGLQHVKVSWPNPDAVTLGEGVFDGVLVLSTILYVPSDTEPMYTDAQWKAFRRIVGCTFDFQADNAEGDAVYYNFNADGVSVTVTCIDSAYESNTYTGALVLPGKVTYGPDEYEVTAIGDYTFYSCSGLTSVEMPQGISSIGESAFYGCTGLTSLTLPDAVEELGESALGYCTGLTELALPAQLRTIGVGAFNHCTNLASVSMAGAVAAIGDNAFSACPALANITIPGSVATIGSYAFQDCTGLEWVKVENTEPTGIALGYNVFYNDAVTDIILYVPNGCIQQYRDADAQWDAFSNIKEFEYSGIGSIAADGSAPAAGSVCYDLTGRRVDNPASGLYIINGRKVLK